MISALLFNLTEMAMADEAINVTPHMLQQLRELKSSLKFSPDEKNNYTGVYDPKERAAADTSFAHLVDVLVSELPRHPTKNFVLDQFKAVLSQFESVDTEDRERATLYCEKIMDVVGIKNSDGLLNDWLYGFPPR
jgi:hypothetical protein